jgi:hypothetical protein
MRGWTLGSSEGVYFPVSWRSALGAVSSGLQSRAEATVVGLTPKFSCERPDRMRAQRAINSAFVCCNDR